RRPAGCAGPAGGGRVEMVGHAQAREDVAAGVLGAAGAHRFASGGGARVRAALADAGAVADGALTVPRRTHGGMLPRHRGRSSNPAGTGRGAPARRAISEPGARFRRLARPARSSSTVRASGQLDMRHGFMPTTTLVTTPSALRNTTSTG